jgi:hypothetical protein
MPTVPRQRDGLTRSLCQAAPPPRGERDRWLLQSIARQAHHAGAVIARGNACATRWTPWLAIAGLYAVLTSGLVWPR